MTAQQLKNSILQMAVQGKLVPQDPNDEPASVLLERIREEKEKLIKAGKIKKEKNPSEIFRGSDNLPYEKTGKETRCIAEEVPFEIPDSWAWLRLGNLITLLSGQDFSPSDYNSHNAGIPYITGASNIENGSILINRWTDSPHNIALRGDLLIVCKGAGVGKMAILDFAKVHIARQIMAIRSYNLISNEYLMLFLTAQVNKIRAQMNGLIPGIDRNVMLSFLTPLPPLAEQRRIVAKIEELLPHLEEYDQAESRVEKLNAEFPEQLKKSILQWAIQGKLVPQNPDDEPASVLLDRIRTEKAKLVKSGKIKKDKIESVIFRRDNSHYEKLSGIERCIDDEIPFEIPDSWAWSRIGSCIELVNGRAYKQSELLDKGKYRVLRVGNFFTNSSWYYSDLELPSDKYCKHGDLLYAWSASFGPRIWDQGKTIFHYHIWNVKFDERLFLKEFLFYFLLWDKERLRGATTGSTMIHISMEHMYPRFIMIPPLAEQKRIVEAIELLFCKLNV